MSLLKERKLEATGRSPGFKLRAAWVLLIAIVIQVAFLVALPKTDRINQSTDYVVFYAPVAHNILNGKGLIDQDCKLASDYPPGFPLYLAANFRLADLLGVSRDSFVIVTNVLLMALSCLLVLRVAELVFNQRVATISALLWITYLFNLWLVKQPNTEVPFILLFYSAIWFFLRGINHGRLASFVTVGALLGVAALVRPIALFLPFVLVLLLLLQPSIALGSRLVGAFSIVLMFLIVISPWEIKLKSETNHVVPLSTNGPSSMLDGLTFAAKVGKAGDRAWVPSSVEMLAGRVRENQRSLHTVGQVAEFMAVEARKDPLAVIEMGLMKIVRSWYGTNAMWHERPTALIQAFYLLLAIPGIWLAHRRFPEKLFLILSLLAIVIYFWAMTVVVLSILRYMVPAIGILLMFGAVSLDSAFMVWGVIWKQKAIVAHRQAETSGEI